MKPTYLLLERQECASTTPKPAAPAPDKTPLAKPEQGEIK